MKVQMKNNDVSEHPLTSFAQQSNYVTSILLSVGTATVCHQCWPNSGLTSLL